jgi:hypothetical protein
VVPLTLILHVLLLKKKEKKELDILTPWIKRKNNLGFASIWPFYSVYEIVTCM